MDFTINTYKELLKALQQQGFSFQTFEEYLENTLLNFEGGAGSPSGDKGASVGNGKKKTIILRHDVDKLPENYSLRS